MTKQQKVNLIARKLGLTLCTAGIKILKSAFHIDPKIVLAHVVRDQVEDRIKLNNLTLSDGKYYLENWDTWKNIFEVDWTDKKKWVLDHYDCDNFAYSFAARMSEIYGINAGIVHGHIYNLETGKWIAGHFWNMILTKELELYFYEPAKDMWVKAGNSAIMNNRKYVPLSARFF